MRHIALMRHGETLELGRFCGETDVALSERGWQQMRSAAGAHPWAHIVSSPSRRCAAFALELAAQAGARHRIDPDLREMHFGDWEGRSAAELSQSEPEALAAFWADPVRHTPPGGERLAILEERVVRAFARAVEETPAGDLLLITHGGPIRVLCALRDGVPRERLLSIEVPHAALIEM
jgi:alpha-ribazole phosphatase